MEYNLFDEVVPASVELVKLGTMLIAVVCILPLAGAMSLGRTLCRILRW